MCADIARHVDDADRHLVKERLQTLIQLLRINNALDQKSKRKHPVDRADRDLHRARPRDAPQIGILCIPVIKQFDQLIQITQIMRIVVSLCKERKLKMPVKFPVGARIPDIVPLLVCQII